MTPTDGKILAAYVADGRLREMPARASRRLVVLRWLAEQLEPGRQYPEREVNELMKRHHPDFAMLRRYLVDHGLLERDHGIYCRPDRAEGGDEPGG